MSNEVNQGIYQPFNNTAGVYSYFIFEMQKNYFVWHRDFVEYVYQNCFISLYNVNNEII